MTLLKIRNGRISIQYADFLKNGILFNMLLPAGDIGTKEREEGYYGDNTKGVNNSFHIDVSKKTE
ncbi:hypothetical protein OP853_000094 [Salmonella enterica]|nr:hypothetical protein [Salmonella enterica]